MQLRFRQLQALHAIIQTGTVTGAANFLGISQPGISNLLNQLERQTKFKLFEREKGRLIATPEALILYQEIDTVVRGIDHVTQSVIDLQNKKAGQLQVASQHSLSFGPLPGMIARFAQDRPEMSIAFQAQYSTKIQEWVMSGLFEIGLCELPLLYDAFDVHPITVNTVIAVPEGDPLAKHEILTPELLNDVPFVVMGPEHITHRKLRETFLASGFGFRPRVHSHLFRNLVSFVTEGLGVALVDPFVVEGEQGDGFVVRPFEPTIPLELAIITSRARPLSSIGQEFLEILKTELAPYHEG
jgi:DNA-binding transcriptional LysR family regulator